jgi:hypothetical protein
MTIPYLCSLVTLEDQKESASIIALPLHPTEASSTPSTISRSVKKRNECEEENERDISILVESVLEDLEGLSTPSSSDDGENEHIQIVDPMLIKSLGNEKLFFDILSKVKKNKKRLFVTCLGIVVYKRIRERAIRSRKR